MKSTILAFNSECQKSVPQVDPNNGHAHGQCQSERDVGVLHDEQPV